MKILYITQFFPPEVGAAANRARNFVKFWSRQGISITVISEVPNYPTGRVNHGYLKDFYRFERISPEIEIIRVPVVPTPSGGSIALKLINNASFYINVRKILNYREFQDFDIVFASTPPLGCVFLGYHFARILGVPLVLDVRDPWPEILLTQNGCDRACRSIVRMISNFMDRFYRSAELIVSPVPFILEHLRKNYHIKKALWVPNGADFEEADSIKPAQCIPHSRFTVIYSGILGRNHGAPLLLEIIRKLSDVDFWVIGDGKDRPHFENARLPNLRYLGVKRWPETFSLIKAADIGIVTLRDNIWMRNAFPVKGIDYLAAGKPVVISIGGVFPRMVREHNAGLFSESNNVDELVDVIKSLKEAPHKVIEMGKNAYNLAHQKFNMKNNALKLLSELAKIA